jgi:hypothetical protein
MEAGRRAIFAFLLRFTLASQAEEQMREPPMRREHTHTGSLSGVFWFLEGFAGSSWVFAGSSLGLRWVS